jgi:hypothetical protein
MTQPIHPIPDPRTSGDVEPADVTDAVAADAMVPCIYCRGVIPADHFHYWSPARRLVYAWCPHCERRMTLAVSTWRRWSNPAGKVSL